MIKDLNPEIFPFAVKSNDGSEYISDHKTFKAAEKKASRQNRLWKGKRQFRVFKACECFAVEIDCTECQIKCQYKS